MKLTLIILTALSVLSSIALLWLIRHPKTPRILDFAAGTQLIILAAFFLGLIGDLRGLIPEGEKIKAGYDVALLIIPFFTAGIGTNIISNVVLADRDYNATITFKEFLKEIWHVLLIISGCLFPPIILIYAIFKTKQHPN